MYFLIEPSSLSQKIIKGFDSLKQKKEKEKEKKNYGRNKSDIHQTCVLVICFQLVYDGPTDE